MTDPIAIPGTGLTIDRASLMALLVAAVEGGSNHWAIFTRPRPSGTSYDTIHVCERSGAYDGDITLTDFAAGLGKLWTLRDDPAFPAARFHLQDALLGVPDAETGDLVMQLACFRERIYV